MPRAIDLTLEVLKADDIFPIPDRKSRMKWNGPWWHMAALYEMGESARVPESAVVKALELLKNGAWPRFVIAREDAPRHDCGSGKNGLLPLRVRRILHDTGIAWMRRGCRTALDARLVRATPIAGRRLELLAGGLSRVRKKLHRFYAAATGSRSFLHQSKIHGRRRELPGRGRTLPHRTSTGLLEDRRPCHQPRVAEAALSPLLRI